VGHKSKPAAVSQQVSIIKCGIWLWFLANIIFVTYVSAIHHPQTLNSHIILVLFVKKLRFVLVRNELEQNTVWSTPPHQIPPHRCAMGQRNRKITPSNL